jgi:hypothetical protein
MRAAALTKLAALAAACAVGGFLVLGVSRLLVGYDIAQVVAAPLFLAGFALAIGLAAVGALWKLGVVEIEE